MKKLQMKLMLLNIATYLLHFMMDNSVLLVHKIDILIYLLINVSNVNILTKKTKYVRKLDNNQIQLIFNMLKIDWFYLLVKLQLNFNKKYHNKLSVALQINHFIAMGNALIVFHHNLYLIIHQANVLVALKILYITLRRLNANNKRKKWQIWFLHQII